MSARNAVTRRILTESSLKRNLFRSKIKPNSKETVLTPKMTKDFTLKTESNEKLLHTLNTPKSKDAGYNSLGSAKLSDRPFSRISMLNLMQPTVACIAHKTNRLLSAANRSFILCSQG